MTNESAILGVIAEQYQQLSSLRAEVTQLHAALARTQAELERSKTLCPSNECPKMETTQKEPESNDHA